MQQVGQEGCTREISDSIIILLGSTSGSSSGSNSGSQFPTPWQELVNVYSIEAEDEAILTEYLESSSCWRTVLAQYLDRSTIGANCLTTNSILYD